MPKKIYVERFGREEGPKERVRTRIIKDFDEFERPREFKFEGDCCGEHKHHKREQNNHGDHRDHKEREYRKHRNDRKRHHVHVRPRFEKKMKTKMFTSKEELVKFVNEVGELGHQIDIFKIEDDLYKVVVVERINLETKVDVELEEDPDQEEIEVEVEIEEE